MLISGMFRLNGMHDGCFLVVIVAFSSVVCSIFVLQIQTEPNCLMCEFSLICSRAHLHTLVHLCESHIRAAYSHCITYRCSDGSRLLLPIKTEKKFEYLSVIV